MATLKFMMIYRPVTTLLLFTAGMLILASVGLHFVPCRADFGFYC